MESLSNELTVFYDGNLHVFKDVPAMQVQALMLLLCQPGGKVDGDVRPMERPVEETTTSSSFSDTSINKRCNSNQLRQPAEKLPFARKASLARFLKARKDNISKTSRETQKTSSKVPPITILNDDSKIINIL